MESFIKYKKNITSQWGEDGIISEIFNRIGTKEKFCIEFGAWDGKHLSNVWNLWHELGWSALLIEGDKEKYNDLTTSVSSFPNVKPHYAHVESYGDNSLDNILKKISFQKEIDLLCIDIDGNDYYIFESLKTRPRVIIIEYNPTIPLGKKVVQDKDQYFGSSATAIYELALRKGYKLVALTETNLFFVDEKEFNKLGIEEQLLENLFISDHLTYIMTAYDGTPAITKIPTYHNITKRTERELHFKNENFLTINLCIYNNRIINKILIKLRNKIIGKISHLLKNNKNEDAQTKRVIPWFEIDGDKTLRLNYPLNSSSLVIDAGGFEGQWSSDIFSKYECNILIFEPVNKFAQQIKERFANNKKITCYNVGLSNKDATSNISLIDNSSSLFKENKDQEEVVLVNASTFLRNKKIESIDLLKINIEGGEYDLLENLIENNLVKNIKNIQVQFHDFVPKAEERMKNIQEKLKKTHHLTYQYEFVWENWGINNE